MARPQASRACRGLAAACGVAIAVASAGAIQMTLDRRAIEEAIYVGQSRIERDRATFHLPYRIRVAQPPVDWIDVVTPFHRVEMAAEANARSGGRQFGQREAFAVLAAAEGRIDLLVEMTFHPLNTFVAVPPYEVVLRAADGTLLKPQRIERFPRFGPRAESPMPELPLPGATPVFGAGQPVLGGSLLAAFDATALDPVGRYEVIVEEAGSELARAAADFAAMR